MEVRLRLCADPDGAQRRRPHDLFPQARLAGLKDCFQQWQWITPHFSVISVKKHELLMLMKSYFQHLLMLSLAF